MANRVAMGDHFYVFSSVLSATEAWSSRPNCIIDCHGRKAVVKPDFTVPPGVNIHFYVTEGAFLVAGEVPSDDGKFYYVDAVDNIARGAAKSVERVGPGHQAPNYVLSKQHAPNSGWAPFRYDHVGYADLLAYLDAKPRIAATYDLISVRNTAFTGEATLYDFVLACQQRAFSYTKIHCCFCRGDWGDIVTNLFGQGRDERPGWGPV